MSAARLAQPTVLRVADLALDPASRKVTRAGALVMLTPREYAEGARALVRKLEALRPAVVALVGVSLARVVLPSSTETGPGPRHARLGRARVFVLPNPSGRNAAFPGFDAKLEWFVRISTQSAAPRVSGVTSTAVSLCPSSVSWGTYGSA